MLRIELTVESATDFADPTPTGLGWPTAASRFSITCRMSVAKRVDWGGQVTVRRARGSWMVHIELVIIVIIGDLLDRARLLVWQCFLGLPLALALIR